MEIKNNPLLSTLLDKSPEYRKVGVVQAQFCSSPETIVTQIMINGKPESTVEAKPGDWIITNPGKERYCISWEKFIDLYIPNPQIGNQFIPQGKIKAIQNPFKQAIKIMTSFGEQLGDENCWIADGLDKAGNRKNELYLIADIAFKETYMQ